MFYEEKLIDGRLYCRGTPDGEWRLVTIDALTRRVLAAEADLERAMENHAADLSAAPEALPPELTAEMRANVVEANRSRAAKGFEPFLKIGSEGWALEQIYAELRRSMNNGEVSR
jgi:hypothetical protein